MDTASKRALEIFALKIRMGIIEGTYNAKAGHPGGSLSAADVFAYLYEKECAMMQKILSGRLGIDLFFQRDIALPVFMPLWQIRDFFLSRI